MTLHCENGKAWLFIGPILFSKRHPAEGRPDIEPQRKFPHSALTNLHWEVWLSSETEAPVPHGQVASDSIAVTFDGVEAMIFFFP